MKAQQSHAHHYVPQWYQKRFLTPGQTNFYLMDLHPETLVWPRGSHQRKAVRRRGPAVCFYEDDLYTLRFGSQTTDAMERWFFGTIDTLGHDAVSRFAEYGGIAEGVTKAFDSLAPYMGAQRFRTPRGLDEIKQRATYLKQSQNATLVGLQSVFQAYTTMWTEGVWEIVRARQSPTKFIVTDDPVTFYCKKVFPSEWKYPNDSSLRQIGTRTLFPLGLDSCLIISHVQFTRNPRATPTEFRINARYYDQAVKHMGEIQFGTELNEEEVNRINYILKRRATRYIAAAEEEWLFPERQVSTTAWQRLDDDWFLLPHLWKVSFTAEVVFGYEDGSFWAADEYGRHPGNAGFKDKRQHERDWITAQLAKQEWARKRIGKSVAHVDDRPRGDIAGDKVMEDYLRREGLLPPEAL